MEMVEFEKAKHVVEHLVASKYRVSLSINDIQILVALLSSSIIIERQQPIVGMFTSHHIPFVLCSRDIEESMKNKNNKYMYNSSLHEEDEHPPLPLTTSQLIRSAYTTFHFSPEETMKMSQELYEMGLITFMQTTSTSYHSDFIQTTSSFIHEKYGREYVNMISPISDEDREAIRVTDISLVRPSCLSGEKLKLYIFIRINTLQSCMTPCHVSKLLATARSVNLFNKECVFSYTCQKILFQGWKIVGDVKIIKQQFEHYEYLSHLRQGGYLSCNHISSHPLHYSADYYLWMELELHQVGDSWSTASAIKNLHRENYISTTTLSIPTYEIDFSEDNPSIVMKNESHDKYILPCVRQSIEIEKIDEIFKSDMPWQQKCLTCNEIISSSSFSSSDNIKEEDREINLGRYKNDNVILKEGKDGHRYMVYKNQNISLSKNLKYSNRPLENIQLDELTKILQKGWILRKVTKDIYIRKGVRGKSDYIIFKKYNTDKCISLEGFQDNDYLTCPTSKIMEWIAEQKDL
jgi:hypothetical protein